jgi:hypothetical protein
VALLTLVEDSFKLGFVFEKVDLADDIYDECEMCFYMVVASKQTVQVFRCSIAQLFVKLIKRLF